MTEEPLDPVSTELESQLRRLETIADPASRGIATDLLAAVLQFHTAALGRMLEMIEKSEAGAAILAGFDGDPLVRSVLLVHDLHPDSFATRVRRALSDLEPLLKKREATAELLSAEGGLVRLRIRGGQSNRGPLAPAVEQAIRAAAPEAVQVIVEESTLAGFVSLDVLRNSSSAASSGITPVEQTTAESLSNRQSAIGNR